jgi:methyl-accepting chemotaxis protein
VNSNYLLHILGSIAGLQLIALFCALFYTHRIVGPVYRVRQVLREAAEGRLPAGIVTLRRRDFFKDLAADLNRCMATMKGYQGAAKEASASIRALKKRLRQEDLPPDELDRALNQIRLAIEDGGAEDHGRNPIE